MKGAGMDLFDNRLKKDPKVRDRLKIIILLKERYKQKDVVFKDKVFDMSSKIFDLSAQE